MKRGYLLLALGVVVGAAAVAGLIWLLGFDKAQQAADTANKVALTVATIVGGYWVYDRFVRERRGESRLDLTVSGESRVILGEPAVYLAVTVGAENVGQEKVDLDHDYCALTVATHETGPAAPGPTPGSEAEQAATSEGRAEVPDEVGWSPLDRVFFVLQEQDSVEPGASFGDQILIKLPGKAPAAEGSGTLVAAKLDLAVQATDGSFWTATSVLTVPEGAHPEPV